MQSIEYVVAYVEDGSTFAVTNWLSQARQIVEKARRANGRADLKIVQTVIHDGRVVRSERVDNSETCR